MNMKGEFFLISGLVVVISLFLIKSSLNLSQIIENKRSLEVSMERKEFLNMRDGLIKTIDYSYNKNESERIENYIVYVRQRLKARAIELNGIAIESNLKDVVEGSPVGLNVTVFNFLGETIQSLNLSFSCDSSSSTLYNIPDNSSRKADFTFLGSNENCTLNANYTTPKESKKYNIQIPVEIGKNKFVGFFDLRVKSLRAENKDEFSKIVEIS
jgi:hypothetical protein